MMSTTVDDRCPGCQRSPGPAALSLGEVPQATVFPWPDDPSSVDTRWPLDIRVCDACGLVHLVAAAPDEPEAPGLSGLAALSTTLGAHVRDRARTLAERHRLGPGSTVLERSSHGNHAPAAFEELGVSVVESATGAVATRLRATGSTVVETLEDLPPASVDLVIDDYALAHDRDPVPVLRALASRLAPGGSVCVEFDDLATIVEGCQFDAFRHGHHLYLSASSLADLGRRAGLRLLSVEATGVHGGAAIATLAREDDRRSVEPSARSAIARAVAGRLAERSTYADLGQRIDRLRTELRAHLESTRAAGRRVLAYGAPSRSVTLTNVVGLTPDLVEFTVDRSTAKHGRTVPGVRLPIRPVEDLEADLPDELLLLAWPLIDEVRRQLAWLADGRTRILRPLPRVELVAAASR
jgi:hypothetical protein